MRRSLQMITNGVLTLTLFWGAGCGSRDLPNEGDAVSKGWISKSEAVPRGGLSNGGNAVSNASISRSGAVAPSGLSIGRGAVSKVSTSKREAAAIDELPGGGDAASKGSTSKNQAVATNDPLKPAGPVSKGSITRSEAVAAATAHLRKLSRLPSKFEIGSAEKDEMGGWTVLIVGLPHKAGRHTFVTVGKDGSILGVIRGK
jgi:hypothetical protein